DLGLVGLVVEDLPLHLPAEQAAVLVQPVDVLLAGDLVDLAGRGEDAGQRQRRADDDRLVRGPGTGARVVAPGAARGGGRHQRRGEPYSLLHGSACLKRTVLSRRLNGRFNGQWTAPVSCTISPPTTVSTERTCRSRSTGTVK